MKKSERMFVGGFSLLISAILGVLWMFERHLDHQNTRLEAIEESLLGIRTDLERFDSLLRSSVVSINSPDDFSNSQVSETGRSGSSEETWIEYWSRRAGALNEFMEQNPQLTIPEMALLESDDLFTAMEGLAFETQADFNKAAARLRLSAKMKIAPRLNAAVQQCIEDSNGELPTSIEQILEVVADPLIRSALERYSVADGNTMYYGLSLGPGDEFAIIERPGLIDETWFSQVAVSKNGAIASQSAWEIIDSIIREKLEDFQIDQGYSATNFDELLPYFGDGIVEDELYEKFELIFEELLNPPSP